VVELKVRKFGNALGVVLPKEVLNRLQTTEDGQLFLLASVNGEYRITPYDPVFERKMKKAEEIRARYRHTLHALSK
jgi:antitoxin component of MazEF toxin-antitoxin module